MDHDVLNGLATIVVLGVGSLVAAWWLKLPSILLLLMVGFLAGEFGAIDPDRQFGEVLLPLVSVSVALILYEGGLSLRFSEIQGVESVVWRLVSVGALATWAVGTLAAWALLGISVPLALLLGAILVVTGPTVVGPLLQHIRPQGRAGPVLKWEGIVIDPIGAALAVLVFEAIAVGTMEGGAQAVATGVLKVAVVGWVLGAGAGFVLALFVRFLWVAEHLENALSLMLVVGVYALSERLAPESGLLTATVMGVVLANQKLADVRHIVEFKENLRVLLISGLFIALAARLRWTDLMVVDPWRILAFVAALVLVARPLCVFISCIGSRLSLAERGFMAWMAPRGIVAAAVASVFADRLVAAGIEGAGAIVPLTFMVIAGTVVLYGLTAAPVARRLGVAHPDPQGMLLVGAGDFPRAVARALTEAGLRIVLVDTNRAHVAAARMEGLDAHAGSIMGEHLLDTIDLSGLGRLMALTPNDWVNTVAVQRFAPVFGRRSVYQLPPPRKGSGERSVHKHLHGRWLFGPDLTAGQIEDRMRRGASVKSTPLTGEWTAEAYRAHYGDRAQPLFVVSGTGRVQVVLEDKLPELAAGDTVIGLVS